MTDLVINGMHVNAKGGSSILQACMDAGFDVPYLCWHKELSPAGKCGVCVVEIDGKLMPSCSTEAVEGMNILTESETVKEARKNALSLMLLSYSASCMSCSKNLECDLQKILCKYGNIKGEYPHFAEMFKPLQRLSFINIDKNRCVLCGKCTRFMSEIAGVYSIFVEGRGDSTQIRFGKETVESELYGNIVDICPAGAITADNKVLNISKKLVPSIDINDSTGNKTYIEVSGDEITAVKPAENKWIANKGRFSFDGLAKNRLDRPFIRKNSKLVPVYWEEAFEAVADKLKKTEGHKIAAIAGGLTDCETMTTFKDMLASLGSYNVDCCGKGAVFDRALRSSYIFNSTFKGLEQADLILFAGCDFRKEAPVLNSVIYRRRNEVTVGVIGEEIDLCYDYEYLGQGLEDMEKVSRGRSAFARKMKQAKYPMIVLGDSFLTDKKASEYYALARKISAMANMEKEDWNGFNVFHKGISKTGGIDLGFIPHKGSLSTDGIIRAVQKHEIDVVFVLGADEVDFSAFERAFKIYVGHHGDEGALNADVVLPAASYAEKSSTYVNVEGFIKRTAKALEPLGQAREDWKIARKLSEYTGYPLPYNTLEEVRKRMVEINPVFGSSMGISLYGNTDDFSNVVCIRNKHYKEFDFFSANSLLRASDNMKEYKDGFGGQTDA